MKKLNLLVFLFVFAFIACEKDEDMYKVLPIDQVTKPVLTAHENIAVTSLNYKDNTIFSWKSADFGTPTATEYSLYVKMGDYEPKLITSAFADSMNVTYLDIAKALYSMPDLEHKKDILAVDLDVDFYIVASIATVYETVQSNTITLKVNIDSQVPLYPDNIYMIGNEFGSWDWNSERVVEMIPVNGHSGKFWAVRYFANPENGFKWCNVKDWNGDFFSLGADEGFTTRDGNAFVSTAGFYIVVVDYTVNKITIEPAQVYGIGDCFGGWDDGQYPFNADGSVMKLTTSAAGDLRIYANATAAGVGGDWWRMEFVILNGKIVYRGTGNDQERFPVEAGKTVILDFNAGTGSIE
jgi:hypothetical protein